HLPVTAPALWADIRLQARELGSLTPFLLHGERSEIETGLPRVYAARWELAGQVLVLLVHTDTTATTPIDLELPPNVAPEVHRLFPGRPEDGLTVAAGRLVGDVGPADVHVVLLDVVPPGAEAPTASFTTSPTVAAFGEPISFDGSVSS